MGWRIAQVYQILNDNHVFIIWSNLYKLFSFSLALTNLGIIDFKHKIKSTNRSNVSEEENCSIIALSLTSFNYAWLTNSHIVRTGTVWEWIPFRSFARSKPMVNTRTKIIIKIKRENENDENSLNFTANNIEYCDIWFGGFWYKTKWELIQKEYCSYLMTYWMTHQFQTACFWGNLRGGNFFSFEIN